MKAGVDMRKNQEQNAIRVMLFMIVLAMLAQLASAQLAKGQQERFLRSDTASGVAVELRGESTILGGEVRFRQIARWADADKATFEPLGDLIVARLSDKQSVRTIGIAELRTLLRDAGVNTSMMNFTGSLSCTVTRGDADVPQDQKLDQLIEAKTPAEQHARPVIESPMEAERGPRSLQAILTADLASRLNIPAATLQVAFRTEDEKLLRLSEPQFQFTINPQRVGNLGDVSWHVSFNNGGKTTRTFVQARALAWQDQLVVSRPLGVGQVITEGDVIERRTLADQVSDDPLLKRDQAVGQQAARDLKPGMVLTGRLVDAVQLVRPGQFVTIEQNNGGVTVRIVARAIDGGKFGQTVRVKNEATREIFRVTVTGPQQASINPPGSMNESNGVARAH